MLGAGFGGDDEEKEGASTGEEGSHVTDEENPLVLHPWVEACGT